MATQVAIFDAFVAEGPAPALSWAVCAQYNVSCSFRCCIMTHEQLPGKTILGARHGQPGSGTDAASG